jgi:hypothetical protein
MTKLFDNAVEAVRQLPSDSQDEIARAMLVLAEADRLKPEPIDPAHLTSVLEGLAEARQRESASDAEIETAFRRFDP